MSYKNFENASEFIYKLYFHENIEDSSKRVTDLYPLGTKSNISRIRKALIERELIEERVDGVFLSDAVFEKWFNREINK